MTIAKQENVLKARFTKVLTTMYPDFVVINHQEIRNSATPDMSVNGNRVTGWLEFKHATPDFKSKGIQEHMMQRLFNHAGYAIYVLFYDVEVKKILVVSPYLISDPFYQYSKVFKGFDYKGLSKYIGSLHGR